MKECIKTFSRTWNKRKVYFPPTALLLHCTLTHTNRERCNQSRGQTLAKRNVTSAVLHVTNPMFIYCRYKHTTITKINYFSCTCYLFTTKRSVSNDGQKLNNTSLWYYLWLHINVKWQNESKLKLTNNIQCIFPILHLNHSHSIVSETDTLTYMNTPQCVSAKHAKKNLTWLTATQNLFQPSYNTYAQICKNVSK